MHKEEFERYREEVLETLKSYRNKIKRDSDSILFKLQILLDNHKIMYKEFIDGEGYPSYPEGAFLFFSQTDKELFCIISHLHETGEWRIPCAVRHFDDLLLLTRD